MSAQPSKDRSDRLVNGIASAIVVGVVVCVVTFVVIRSFLSPVEGQQA